MEIAYIKIVISFWTERIEMDRNSIRKEILEYLARFPNAQDSLEGIAKWWVQSDEKDVEMVLCELVRERIMIKKECALKAVYCLSEESKSEIVGGVRRSGSKWGESS
ncbi:MAG: hypothetical protein QXH17_09790 [Candidatus Bathyarchaeia archaeon]